MKTYLAKLIFNIQLERKESAPQFDEQIRMIYANNLEDAFMKARLLGKREESSFYNNNNELVQWKFIDVSELHSLQDIADGEQIYSATHETSDTFSFVEFVREKAMRIQTNFLTFA